MKRIGRLGALMLATAMGFGSVASIRVPAPIAQENAATATKTNKDTTPPPTSAVQAPIVKMDRRVVGGLDVFTQPGFIWQARAKRGNRRGRSRWNYNR